MGYQRSGTAIGYMSFANKWELSCDLNLEKVSAELNETSKMFQIDGAKQVKHGEPIAVLQDCFDSIIWLSNCQ